MTDTLTTSKPAAHTPGPWETHGIKAPTYVTDTEGRTIADCDTGWNTAPSKQGEAEANARLIAAAPDLLAALKECLPLFEHVACGEVRDMVDRAINKAEAQ